MRYNGMCVTVGAYLKKSSWLLILQMCAESNVTEGASAHAAFLMAVPQCGTKVTAPLSLNLFFSLSCHLFCVSSCLYRSIYVFMSLSFSHSTSHLSVSVSHYLSVSFSHSHYCVSLYLSLFLSLSLVPDDQALRDPQSPTAAGRTHPGGPPAQHAGKAPHLT